MISETPPEYPLDLPEAVTDSLRQAAQKEDTQQVESILREFLLARVPDMIKKLQVRFAAEDEAFVLHNYCGLANAMAAMEVINTLRFPAILMRVSGKIFGQRNWDFHSVGYMRISENMYAMIDVSNVDAQHEIIVKTGKPQELQQVTEQEFGGLWPFAFQNEKDPTLSVESKLGDAQTIIDEKSLAEEADFKLLGQRSLGLNLTIPEEETLELLKANPRYIGKFLSPHPL